MAELNEPGDFLTDINGKKKLPGSLNVLSILTFIGCGVGLLWTFGGFAFMNWSLKMMDNAQSSNANLSEKQVNDMDKSRLIIEKVLAHKWPLILIGLVGIILCFYGAMNMRKLKKDGFYIYTVGELLPILASTVLLGFSTQFNGVFSYIFNIGIPLLFVFLYSRNLQYLK
jgi:hypothetical protein